MRKLTLFIACSLDGYIAREDGSVDWLFTDADYGYRKFFSSIGTMLMGRKTYEKALSLGDRSYGEKKWVVLSRKGGSGPHGVVFAHDPLATARRLRRGRGKGIWLVGGSEIAAQLLAAGLIDEMVISVHPIILGGGIPLFRKGVRETRMRLVRSKAFRSGLVQMVFARR